MEKQLASLEIRMQDPCVQCQQSYLFQYQAVLLMEQGATTAGPPLLRVLYPSSHVYYITPSLHPQQYPHSHTEMVGGKVPPSPKF